ncbi:Hsp20/alpha crystallin family protein [Shimazuella sp. AN120528]|uniref:Hsp20/alpha crystallin family protein n=1 Tax=Shimazuella soli TaxID=1892854 RepID=UPI001F102361|nr:Hsp20/alpha crystallin family protein [Shimazuella soli]MCH5586556.1 Hsp20/alpha crystallin family protein [Shimazuella soli]
MTKKSFAEIHELARAFLGEDFFQEMGNITAASSPSQPAADVYQSRNEVIVVVNLPGMENIHTIDISIEDTNLKLKGAFESPYQAYEATLMERKRGVFEREIPLGVKVQPKYESARYKKGVLELRYRKQV